MKTSRQQKSYVESASMHAREFGEDPAEIANWTWPF